MRRLGNLLSLAGFLALATGGLVWANNMPAQPQGRANDMWGALNAGVANARSQAYPRCLYSAPSPGFSCPLDGNLHMLMWAGAGLLLIGLMLRMGAAKSGGAA